MPNNQIVRDTYHSLPVLDLDQIPVMVARAAHRKLLRLQATGTPGVAIMRQVLAESVLLIPGIRYSPRGKGKPDADTD